MARLKNLNRIALFGGTFNPIHHGHLKMAEAARKEYKLDVIYFIPCGIPPHKSKKDLLPAKLRMKLLKESIQGKKYFKVLDIEIKKKKPCYTVDTIRELYVGIGRDQSLQLFFLIGQDEFEDLHTWHKPKELAKMVTFLVLPRVGATPKCLPKKNNNRNKMKIPKVKNLQWFKVHRKPINISSSQIRENMG